LALGEEDSCLHVALHVAAFLEMLIKSVIMRTTTATRTGCVQRGRWVKQSPFQGGAAQMLPKMTYNPA